MQQAKIPGLHRNLSISVTVPKVV